MHFEHLQFRKGIDLINLFSEVIAFKSSAEIFINKNNIFLLMKNKRKIPIIQDVYSDLEKKASELAYFLNISVRNM